MVNYAGDLFLLDHSPVQTNEFLKISTTNELAFYILIEQLKL